MAESRDITAEHAPNRARIEADVGVEHIAEVYAQAVLDAAEAAGQTKALIEEFDSLVTDVPDRQPKFEAVICLTTDLARGIRGRFGSRAGRPGIAAFFELCSRSFRGTAGWIVCGRYTRRLYAMYDGAAKPRPLAIDHRRAPRHGTGQPHRASPCAQLKGEPILEPAVDPELIGGAVLRLGDTVYDGSIANQLQILRQQMIERSVHEIQSRRDRFRYPAGN